MSERVVSIKLLADATGMVLGLGKARDAVAETKAKVEESARSNREAWSTVGTGLTAVGVAITGIGALALKTGISYNSMQQSTRAALTTLLGSAAAANAQMDKLDAFARNSPFAKQTFIAAQQQMLAFGIETQKVIPYLDAVQNAVAAAGGSNADIEGIVATMSKIQSSSKITAQDLNEFGNRGVNAAELIGSQMGKTGAQIREDITSGSLDATQALDALASGMSDRFGGAADNVKQTFDGAMDRVKAAWRDFAAELAKPLVDPNGGGALVDLLNWTADAMRNFEDLPEPIKRVTSELVGMTGVAALATGSAMMILPQWVAFKDALADLGVTSGLVRGNLKSLGAFLTTPMGVAIAAAVAALIVLDIEMKKVQATTEELQNKLQTSSWDDTWSAVTRGKAVIETVGQALDDMGGTLDRIGESNKNWAADLFEPTYVARFKSVLADLGPELSSLADSDLPKLQKRMQELREEHDLTDAQMRVFIGSASGLEDALRRQATEMGLTATESNLLALAMGDIEPAAQKNTDSLESIQGAAAGVSEAIVDLADEIRNFGSAQMDAESAAIKFEEELANVRDRLAEGATGLAITTQAGRDNRQSLLDLATAANESAAATLAASGSQDQANAALQYGRDALIAAAIQYGMTEAEAKAYADQLLATPETVATTAQIYGIESAEERLAWVARRREALIEIKTSGGEGSGALNYSPFAAAGGTVGRLPVSGFAQGGTIPGIGGYVAGGTVFGRGTTQSDSVMVRLSRGEEVIRASQAEEFRPLLKSINRGDFHAGMIQPQVVVAASSTPREVPTELVVRDVNGALVGRMQVEAARQVSDASAAGGSRVRQGSDRRR
ncbi:tape measure protein [Leucobacter sp. W1153]|uniref:tape measure protein n=1 Tax=Leucobacter sp. W1153 TaxID=3439064 RepID=UPI003F38DEAB